MRKIETCEDMGWLHSQLAKSKDAARTKAIKARLASLRRTINAAPTLGGFSLAVTEPVEG